MVCLMLCSAGWHYLIPASLVLWSFLLHVKALWISILGGAQPSLYSLNQLFLNKEKSVTKSHDTVRSLPFMFNDSVLLMNSLFMSLSVIYAAFKQYLMPDFLWVGRLGMKSKVKRCRSRAHGVINERDWHCCLKMASFKKKNHKPWRTVVLKTLRWANGSQPVEQRGFLKNKREMMKVGTITNLSRVSTAWSEQQSIFVWSFIPFLT